MKKVIRLTESELINIVRKIIKEETIKPSEKVVKYLKDNKIKSGDYVVIEDMYGTNLHLQYFPPSTMGVSKKKTITKVPVPNGLNKTNGKWSYNGTNITLT